MRNLTYILFLTLITSCTTYRLKTVSGNYRTKGGFEWGSWIDLRPDSSFVYKWQGGLIYGETTGNWLIKGNSLILNSDLQPQSDTLSKFHLIHTANNNADKITFDLFWPDSMQSLSGALGLMFYNGDTIDGRVSDLDGRMIFNKQLVDSIKIYFISLNDIVMTNINSDYYKIVTTEDNDKMYEFFSDEIWKVRGDYLIDKTRNDYYYEKRFYKIK